MEEDAIEFDFQELEEIGVNMVVFPRLQGMFPRVLGGQPFPRVRVEGELSEDDIDQMVQQFETQLRKALEEEDVDTSVESDSTFG